jgi:hypothetical protein
MKKILFVLFALMVNQPAMAQWVEFGGDLSVRAYYDPSRIESYAGVYKSTWVLTDYGTIQREQFSKAPFQSSVVRWIVDCSKKESKVIAGYWYSEKGGKGEIVHSESSDRISFESAPPNSYQDSLINLACAKKK